MSIKPLPEDVVAQIKSSTTITSINGVVDGLIQNSLDAGATKISISIDYSRGNCSVEDNGSGILPSEYASTGGLGKLHYTSRFPAHPSYYGSSGTFLASVAALSLITITSHHEGHRSHNSIKIHNSKVIARHTPSPPDQRLLSFSHGTRVTVRDLFGSMPVRVKQRALVLDRTTTLRDWENLKLSIIAILLAWPEQVSISIRETTSQQATVLRNTESIVTQLAEKARRSLLLSRISGLLCQASFFDDADPATWVALKASAAQLSITGAVCLLPVATKRLQFISIGIQPLPNIRGQNVLYEEINRMFASSSFGFEEETDGIDEEERVRRAQDRRFKTEEYTTRELRGKRGIDRHPMFYVHVDLDDLASYKAGHEVDEILDGRQSHLHTIVDVIKAMIHAFLKKHHFHPLSYRPTRRRSPKRFRTNVPEIESSSRDDSPGLSSSSISRTGMTLKTQALPEPDHKEAVYARSIRGRSENVSHYNDWPKISSGSQTPVSDADLGFEGTKVRRPHSQSRNDNDAMAPTSPALFDTKGDLIRPPFLDLDQAFVSGDAQLNTNAEGSDQASRHGDTMAWVNPITKQKCIVDARTGFVSNRANVDEEHGLKWEPNRLTKKVKGLEKPLIPARVEPSPWVEDLLTRWKNPVFEATEPPIPVAFDASALADTTNGYTECSSSSHDGVDASLLVIIDQHAADERCKVEELMASYFNVGGARKTSFQATTESLNKVIQYEIASHERLLFEQYLTHFKHWGIGYSLNTYPSVPQLESRKLPSFVKVSTLPPCIAERCLTEPRLLIDLMRKEVWKLNETCGGHGHLPHQTALVDEHDSTEQHWLSRFHGCPQGILDMINSRACRSAIMFNDTLSMGECKALLGRLAECAFPFQCAHGRPSMVPLVDMGNQQLDEAETGSFGKQFRTWQEKMGRRRRHS
ncbi:DNA mismatch repair protein [Neopestalotiopsis sp. 37M]|nr:DNA mismatch repair protein [Neopestalotiopsis sp. 37M]